MEPDPLSRCNVLSWPPHPVCPPHVMVNRIASPAVKFHHWLSFTVCDETFTVSNETYIGIHRTAPTSFVTYNWWWSFIANCKIFQSVMKLLQLVMQSITRVWRQLKSKLVCPGGEWKQNFWFGTPPPPRVLVGGEGGRLKTFHRSHSPHLSRSRAVWMCHEAYLFLWKTVKL